MFVRPKLTPLLRLLGGAIILLLAFDLLLFRSGAYFRVMTNASTSGSVVAKLQAVRDHHSPAQRNVLVLGDSRVGEGFSARDANAHLARPDLNFVNGAVAGTGLRVWHYLLRELDPGRDRYAAVALMLPFQFDEVQPDQMDNRLDAAYLVPLANPVDLPTLWESYSDPALQRRALRNLLFPAHALRDDILDFVRSPQKRWDSAQWRLHHYSDTTFNYEGRDARLPEFGVDPHQRTIVDWAGQQQETQPKLQGYLRGLAPGAVAGNRDQNIRHTHRWLRRIAMAYAGSDTQLLVFAPPRGPLHGPLQIPRPIDPWLLELATELDIAIVDAAASTSVEYPRYFFDDLHLNAAGRDAWTPRLADALTERLGGPD